MDDFHDEIMRHSVSDFIARNYEFNVSFPIFLKWAHHGTKYRLHAAQVGFEVLIMSRSLSRKDTSLVRSELKKIIE